MDMLTRLWLVAVLGIAAICAYTGYHISEGVQYRALAECRLEQAKDRAEQATARETAALAQLADIQSRQARADQLTRDLAAARQAASKLKQERQDALERHTDNNTCLRDAALRLLDGAPGLRVQLSEATGGADRTDAARVASDADLAGWALDAGEQYAECVRRYHALIDWSGVEHGDEP